MCRWRERELKSRNVVGLLYRDSTPWLAIGGRLHPALDIQQFSEISPTQPKGHNRDGLNLLGHKTGTEWAQLGHKQKCPLKSGHLLLAITAILLVAREGFEPPTFGL